MNKQSLPNGHKTWEPDDVRQLAKLAGTMPVEKISEVIGISVNRIRNKAKYQYIELGVK